MFNLCAGTRHSADLTTDGRELGNPIDLSKIYILKACASSSATIHAWRAGGGGATVSINDCISTSSQLAKCEIKA